MAARPRTVPTPAAYQEFVERVWKAETKQRFPYRLRVRNGEHVPRHCGVGGASRVMNQRFYELLVDVFAPCPGEEEVSWLEVQYVLLHEIAHLLLPITINHERPFYMQAYRLYIKYLPDTYVATAISREINYIPKYARPAAKYMKLERYIT